MQLYAAAKLLYNQSTAKKMSFKEVLLERPAVGMMSLILNGRKTDQGNII